MDILTAHIPPQIFSSHTGVRVRMGVTLYYSVGAEQDAHSAEKLIRHGTVVVEEIVRTHRADELLNNLDVVAQEVCEALNVRVKTDGMVVDKVAFSGVRM